MYYNSAKPVRTFRIAVHGDEVIHADGQRQSYSERWMEIGSEAGHEMRQVNAFSFDLFHQLEGCDGFMWRFGFLPVPRVLAEKVIPAVEKGMGIPVFPDTNTAWHFEDKIAQKFMLDSIGISQPETHIFWNREHALEYCATASYPIVIKLAHGFKSKNVRLVKNYTEARAWVEELFGPGLASLDHSPVTFLGRTLRRAKAGGRLMLGLRPRGGADFSHGYLYAQEFLPGNAFDTRITVIGDRAFGFRRFNRDDDFRASGSGRIDWDPDAIQMEEVQLAFDVAKRLRSQCVAIDILKRGLENVVGEISYTGASWALAECPGHWRRPNRADSNKIDWIHGTVRPEDAIFDDFIEELHTCADRSS